MNKRKIKKKDGKMTDVVDGSCQNQRVARYPLFLPCVSLYRHCLDLEFIFFVAEIFYLYLIN